MGYGEHHLDHGPRNENPYFGGFGISPISSEQKYGKVTLQQLHALKEKERNKTQETEDSEDSKDSKDSKEGNV